MDFESSSGLSQSSRATAEELDGELKTIVEHATSAGRQLEWMNWSAPPLQGPKRFGERLVASDAADKREQQV